MIGLCGALAMLAGCGQTSEEALRKQTEEEHERVKRELNQSGPGPAVGIYPGRRDPEPLPQQSDQPATSAFVPDQGLVTPGEQNLGGPPSTSSAGQNNGADVWAERRTAGQPQTPPVQLDPQTGRYGYGVQGAPEGYTIPMDRQQPNQPTLSPPYNPQPTTVPGTSGQ